MTQLLKSTSTAGTGDASSSCCLPTDLQLCWLGETARGYADVGELAAAVVARYPHAVGRLADAETALIWACEADRARDEAAGDFGASVVGHIFL